MCKLDAEESMCFSNVSMFEVIWVIFSKVYFVKEIPIPYSENASNYKIPSRNQAESIA